MKLDDEFLNQVSGPIEDVWQQIASDAMAVSQEMGEEMSNAEAMELVLDADRLTTFGHPAEDQLIEAAIKEHGYDKVGRFLRKHIRLA